MTPMAGLEGGWDLQHGAAGRQAANAREERPAASREVPTGALSVEAVPHVRALERELAAFAATFSGYRHVGGPSQCAEVCNRLRERWHWTATSPICSMSSAPAFLPARSRASLRS